MSWLTATVVLLDGVLIALHDRSAVKLEDGRR